MTATTKKPVNPWLIATIVSLATFMEILDTTITSVSIRHIGGVLAASPEESTWVLTSYLVANGIVLPISGWLADALGRKQFFLWCIAGFTLTSFACGAATSLFMLIFFRLLQGVAGGGLQPTQQAIILDSFPPEKRAAAFAFTSLTVIVAPILGPTLGGWITDNYSWRWIFYINVPVGIAVFILIWRLLEDPPHAKAKGITKIDYTGLGLIVLGLGTMQYVLDKGQQLDWFDNNYIIACSAIIIASLTFGSYWMWRQKDPLIDLHLLKDRGFAMSCVLIFMVGFVLYGGSTLLPLMLQTRFGYDATTAGLVLSPSAVLVLFVMPLAAKIISKVQARYLTTLGLLLCAAGMWYTMQFSPETDYETFVVMRITQMIGLPLLFIPISILAFQHIPKEKSNKSSALFSMFRNLGGSVGIALTTTYAARHTQMHQAYLSEHLSYYDPVFRETLAQSVKVIGNTENAMQQLYGTLQQQASLLAYIDTFQMMAGLMIVSAIAALILLPANDLHKPLQPMGH
ncbi:MAG: DHA2 family efflux MFS transporter permease subunit [Rickettsiales bacterium]